MSGKGQIAGDGFTRQLESITRYAKANDIKIVQVFKDGGVTGTRELTERPAFTEMLAALHANGVRLILIGKLDRLARDLSVQESIIAELKKHGFELISVEEPDLLKRRPLQGDVPAIPRGDFSGREDQYRSQAPGRKAAHEGEDGPL